MTRNCIAALAAVVFLALPASAQETTADTVVATVNGTGITVGHMIVARARLPQQYQQIPDDVLFEALLEQLIQQEALFSSAGEPSRRAQLVLDNERRSLVVGEILEAATAEALTDEALQAAYDTAYANAEPEEEFNAAHILVETEEKAAELADELEGGADFGELARTHSTGPSGPNGGDLGWFSRGMMVPEFESAVVALEAGQVSQPVQTQFGWHVIRLNEIRQKDAPPLDAVREELAQTIQQDTVEAVLAKASEGAEITRAEQGAIDPSVLSNFGLLEE